MLCQHNILGHSFLHAFRRHKALLSVDPATQRGPLPTAIALWLPASKHQYRMLAELRYCDANADAPDTAPLVISPPLSMASSMSVVQRHWKLGRSATLTTVMSYECLAAALEPGQKIKIPLEDNFNPAHLSFAVTIVRKRDGKCKRIFEFPSPSESFWDFGDQALRFECPSASELAHRAVATDMAKMQYFTRCPCGLQVQLGIAPGTGAYQAECVEIYSYGDDGELLEDGIRETLLRIEHVGIWF